MKEKGAGGGGVICFCGLIANEFLSFSLLLGMCFSFSFSFSFSFLRFLFIYLREREREGKQAQAGGVGKGEAGPPLSREPDSGLDPRALGS